jgi:hypothetical protein
MTIHTNGKTGPRLTTKGVKRPYRSPSLQEVAPDGIPDATAQRLRDLANKHCPVGKELSLQMFESVARTAYGQAANGQCEFTDVSAWLQEFGEARNMSERFGVEAFHDAIAGAAEEVDMDYRKRRFEDDDRAFRDEILPDPKPPKHRDAKAKADEIIPFKTFDAGDWEDVPIEPRCWVVRNRIPMGEPGIMSGDGGTGKTKLLLQLAVPVAAELPNGEKLQDWIGGLVETHGPVIIYSAEEKLKEMHRRWSDILNHRGLAFSIFRGRVHFICDEKDTVLATTDEHKGIVTPRAGRKCVDAGTGRKRAGCRRSLPEGAVSLDRPGPRSRTASGNQQRRESHLRAPRRQRPAQTRPRSRPATTARCPKNPHRNRRLGSPAAQISAARASPNDNYGELCAVKKNYAGCFQPLFQPGLEGSWKATGQKPASSC